VARLQIPVNGITHYATTLSVTPVFNTLGLYMVNNGVTFLEITTISSFSETVTIQVPAGADTNLTVGPRTFSIPTGATAVYKTGFFPVKTYGSQLIIDVSSSDLRFAAYTFSA